MNLTVNQSTNTNFKAYNYTPTFKSGKIKQIGKKFGESKLTEKLSDLEFKIIDVLGRGFERPNYKAEKSFKALSSRLKFDYYLNKFNYFFDEIRINHRLIELMTPKKYRETPIQNNAQEYIDKGYEFVMKNKNNLEKLSLESHTNNNDYIKGMLKALKELGLVK